MIEVKIPQARRSLSAPEKTVFEMYENGKSWPQICKVMHLNYDDAKILLAQCREKGHWPDEKKREDNMKKISDDKKQRATKLISAGVDQKTIADTLQVSRSTVQRIAVQLRAETKAPETVTEPAETVSTEPETVSTEPETVSEPACENWHEEHHAFDHFVAYEIARAAHGDEDMPPFVVTPENVDQFEAAWEQYYKEHPDKRPVPYVDESAKKAAETAVAAPTEKEIITDNNIHLKSDNVKACKLNHVALQALIRSWRELSDEIRDIEHDMDELRHCIEDNGYDFEMLMEFEL